jgi:hypothetical protein
MGNYLATAWGLGSGEEQVSPSKSERLNYSLNYVLQKILFSASNKLSGCLVSGTKFSPSLSYRLFGY